MKTVTRTTFLAALALMAGTTIATAQSSGASPADPNNERNLNVAPSNAQPSDPAANSNPAARVPTAPVDRREAQSEEGGETGTNRNVVLPPPAPPAYQ
jgi:hypothetical protein